MKLYHVSGWDLLSTIKEGETFTLLPGPQGAEGKGVYFSEEEPRPTAAEGAQNRITAVVVVFAGSKGWWLSKSAKARKFEKPRTWHTQGKSLTCQAQQINQFLIGDQVVPHIICTWIWG
jgi:hypothetical protein